MHFDVERINLSRLQVPRLAHRIPLRAVDPRAGYLRDRAVGRHIREPRNPVRQRRLAEARSKACGRPRIATVLLQRRRIINQTESIHRPHIAQQLAPPESRFHADRRHIFELMRVSGRAGVPARE